MGFFPWGLRASGGRPCPRCPDLVQKPPESRPGGREQLPPRSPSPRSSRPRPRRCCAGRRRSGSVAGHPHDDRLRHAATARVGDEAPAEVVEPDVLQAELPPGAAEELPRVIPPGAGLGVHEDVLAAEPPRNQLERQPVCRTGSSPETVASSLCRTPSWAG